MIFIDPVTVSVAIFKNEICRIAPSPDRSLVKIFLTSLYKYLFSFEQVIEKEGKLNHLRFQRIILQKCYRTGNFQPGLVGGGCQIYHTVKLLGLHNTKDPE